MKTVITLLCVAALALAAVFFAPSVLGGGAHVEWVLAALAVAVVVARWWVVARRRQRQKRQELRDPALW
jgi:membrane protein implicated in regulation of membrane protease activity